jgi:hypothetical protein
MPAPFILEAFSKVVVDGITFTVQPTRARASWDLRIGKSPPPMKILLTWRGRSTDRPRSARRGIAKSTVTLAPVGLVLDAAHSCQVGQPR